MTPTPIESASLRTPARLLRSLFLAKAKNPVAALLAVLCAAIVAACEPAVPALLKPLLDQGFVGAPTFPLWWVPAILISLFAVRSVAWLVSQYLTQWITHNLLAEVRARVFSQSVDADLAQFRSEKASGLVGASVYEAQMSLGTIFSSVLTAFRDGLTLLALVGYLFWLNWRLTLITLAILLPLLVVVRLIGTRVKQLALLWQRSAEDVSYALEEAVLAATEIRLHNIQNRLRDKFAGLNQRMRRTAIRAAVSGSSITPATQMLSAIALAVVLMFALWQREQAQHTVGSFVAFITAMLMTLSPLRHLADVMQPLLRAVVSLGRLQGILTIPKEDDTGHYAPPHTNGFISFEHLSVEFGKPPQPILEDLSLDVRPGERIAIVGPSGAGKTTLVRLIPRLIHCSAGRVMIDEVDVRQWRLDALRKQVAMVSQEIVLLDDSIAENVVFGSRFDDKKLWAAIDNAALGEFVRSLPQGIETRVGHNGSRLSGGQRQRLAIARAFYKDAPILILDEATSALDSQSEQTIQEALGRLMQGKTVVIIAHRLATIEGADRIAVMDQGRLVELGSHAELIRQRGLYARLHALQFKTEEKTEEVK